MSEAITPAFLIVGTPRSGTTLVQAMVSELPSVYVPPETHFFTDFALDLRNRRTFPLSETELSEELRTYCALPELAGVALDAKKIVARLGGECHGLAPLFSEIVRCLAGDAELAGEKTPGHLLWWRPLERWMPKLKIIVVTRDPRATIASNLTAWGDRWTVPITLGCAIHAMQWSLDQREAEEAGRVLGSDRVLALRYEDVVRIPALARAQLATFLGVSDAIARKPAGPLFPPWETWKARANEAVTSERIDSWRSVLSTEQVGLIEEISESEMRRLGYEVESPGAAALGRRERLIVRSAERNRAALMDRILACGAL